ncbi:MAG TPA: copper resistance system multicopper oxidase [Thermoanaerobaculia bacterium]|nr:copper resistance system multicopper oxidase [Thermoanaerobaculia bacterium]
MEQPLTRRQLLRTAGVLGATGALRPLLPAWARSGVHDAPLRGDTNTGLRELSGTRFDLEIGHSSVVIDGRRGNAITINGTVPGPLLRWREGDEVTLRVSNRLHHHDTSIHWHGILLPPGMDGVPGISFPGIAPGETFEYRFPVKQAGTYWYHSHSGLQEQIGHYGPLIVDPAGPDPVVFDREYVVVLADWTFEDPHRLFARLKKHAESLNFQQRTVGDFLHRVREEGLAAALRDRWMWGEMRMAPTDLSDVGGATYTYLINGHGPEDNWTALFEPGQRIRLRFVNAAAMTLFNVRIPGLPMTVVQADGLNVEPVETDELQIGVAETYDVIVQPETAEAFTLMCESVERLGYARGTLAPRLGMEAPVPSLREPFLLTMMDMGMPHGSMNHGAMDRGAAVHAQMDHGAHAEADPATPPAPVAHDHARGPGVAGVAAEPTNRLAERPGGLEDVAHRVLTYAQLRALDPNPDTRLPEREIELHLTGNMERYIWSFDGMKFSEQEDPIFLGQGERVRLTLVNDTMMPHPIHLHGAFFELVLPDRAHRVDDHRARKHTVVVKPGERLSVDVTHEEVGDWAFHCHLLYHMHAGMMHTVAVRPRDQRAREEVSS